MYNVYPLLGAAFVVCRFHMGQNDCDKIIVRRDTISPFLPFTERSVVRYFSFIPVRSASKLAQVKESATEQRVGGVLNQDEHFRVI